MGGTRVPTIYIILWVAWMVSASVDVARGPRIPTAPILCRPSDRIRAQRQAVRSTVSTPTRSLDRPSPVRVWRKHCPASRGVTGGSRTTANEPTFVRSTWERQNGLRHCTSLRILPGSLSLALLPHFPTILGHRSTIATPARRSHRAPAAETMPRISQRDHEDPHELLYALEAVTSSRRLEPTNIPGRESRKPRTVSLFTHVLNTIDRGR